MPWKPAKTEKAKTYRRAKTDRGWVLSRLLATNLHTRVNVDGSLPKLTKAQVDTLLDLLGDEIRDLFVEGHAVGIPKFGVLWSSKVRTVQDFGGGKRRWHKVPRARIKVADHTQKEIAQRYIDRGTLRTQYDKVRTKLVGFPYWPPRKRFKTHGDDV